MKLLSKYSRINTLITVIIFLIGAVVFYVVLHYMLMDQLDETLLSEKQEIESFVSEHHALPEIVNTKKQWIVITPSGSQTESRARFQTTTRYKARAKEYEPIRQLLFPLAVSGNSYLVTVNKSEVETEDLLWLIVPSVLGLVVLVLAAGLILNRTVVRRLWRPFYSTLDRVREYRVSERQPLALDKLSIDELSLLNETLNEMTQRIHGDYMRLQEFTGNAAHEMQTPLAVIRSKIERMTQHAQQDEKMLHALSEIDDAATRLAQLHQSLLLLTRIENRQFLVNEPVNLDEILKHQLNNRIEWLGTKNIVLQKISTPVTMPFHSQLAEVLISNLIGNACRYTPEGGQIVITLDNSSLVVKNTAGNGALDTSRVFQRFYKNNSEGTGLGLAISHEISNLAGFKMDYDFQNDMHIFKVLFRSKQATP